MPSNKEGFGIVYLEAWQHGLPVICSSVGAPSEIISDGVDGYVIDPTNVPALADRLHDLLTQPGWRRRWANAAVRRSSGNISTRIFAFTSRPSPRNCPAMRSSTNLLQTERCHCSLERDGRDSVRTEAASSMPRASRPWLSRLIRSSRIAFLSLSVCINARYWSEEPATSGIALRNKAIWSECVFTMNLAQDGHDANLDIEKHRPIVDIKQIAAHAVLYLFDGCRLAAPAIDLRPAGNAVLDAMT